MLFILVVEVLRAFLYFANPLSVLPLSLLLLLFPFCSKMSSDVKPGGGECVGCPHERCPFSTESYFSLEQTHWKMWKRSTNGIFWKLCTQRQWIGAYSRPKDDNGAERSIFLNKGVGWSLFMTIRRKVVQMIHHSICCWSAQKLYYS